MADRVGIYNQALGRFYLRYDLESGPADTNFSFGFGGPAWAPVVGDWNGNGDDGIGIYSNETGRFYFKNELSGGGDDLTIRFGTGGEVWKPLVGNWNGEDGDGIGLYNTDTGLFFYKNEISGGAADGSFTFGAGGSAWVPLVGNWDGENGDGIGLYNTQTGWFYLKNELGGGAANKSFSFGPGGANWHPIVGDWNNDGKDSIGLYNSDTGFFYLKDEAGPGIADTVFSVGSGGGIPIAGNWAAAPPPPPPVVGKTAYLTEGVDNSKMGHENVTGTGASDTFLAPLGMSMMGSTMNTLQSPDVIDGKGGRNELKADLIWEAGQHGPRVIEPTTYKIQEMYFNARESVGSWLDDVTAADQVVVLNGRKFHDWDHIESYYSDVDLKVYSLTTNKSPSGTTFLSDMTIAMNHTAGHTLPTDSQLQRPTGWIAEDDSDGLHGSGHYINGKLEASSMKALFDENYIIPTTFPGEDRVVYRIMNMDAVDQGFDALLAVNVREFKFEFNGVLYDLAPYLGDDDLLGTDIQTYQQLVLGLQDALADLIADNPGVGLEDLTISIGDQFTTSHPDTQNQLTGLEIWLTTTMAHDLEAEEWWAVINPSTGAPIVDGVVVRNSARYERAEEIRGEFTQELKIDIELEKVGRGFDGGGLIVGGDNYTKGFDEFDVYVRGDASKPSSLAYLLTTPHGGLDAITIYTHPDYLIPGGTYADLTIGNSNTPDYSILDVKTFNAAPFQGTLTVNYAVIQTPDVYTYILGNTSDTLDIHVVTNALNQQNTSLTILGNNGNNTINVNYGMADGVDGPAPNTMIITGTGADTIVISDVPDGWSFFDGLGEWLAQAAEGDELLTTDTGFISYIDTDGGNDAVFLQGHADFCGRPTDVYTIYQNTGAEYYFFGGKLQLSFNGLKSAWIDIESTNYITTNAQLKQAVRDAIADPSRPELQSLIRVTDADGGGLNLTLLSGGEFHIDDLVIDVRGPSPLLLGTNSVSGITGYYGGTGQDGVDAVPDYVSAAAISPDDAWGYLHFPGLSGVMTKATAQQLVSAWQSYFGPDSDVALRNSEIQGRVVESSPDFTSGDEAQSLGDTDYAEEWDGTDVDDISAFLQWIQGNAVAMRVDANNALGFGAYDGQVTHAARGSNENGFHIVNLGTGNDIVVAAGGNDDGLVGGFGIEALVLSAMNSTTTVMVVEDRSFGSNTVLFNTDSALLGASVRFADLDGAGAGSIYHDSVAAARGSSINDTLTTGTVRDGYVPFHDVSIGSFLTDFTGGSSLLGHVEGYIFETTNRWGGSSDQTEALQNLQYHRWAEDDGAQHNTVSYFHFSDLWNMLEYDNALVANPVNSFANFTATQLQSVLNYLVRADGDYLDEFDIRLANNYVDHVEGGDLGFNFANNAAAVVGARFIILVGKDGEVIEQPFGEIDGTPRPDTDVDWMIEPDFASGDMKVFTGQVVNAGTSADPILRIGNVEEHGIINLVGGNFDFNDLDMWLEEIATLGGLP